MDAMLNTLPSKGEAALKPRGTGLLGFVIGFLGVKRRVEERFLLAAYPGYARYRERTVAFP